MMFTETCVTWATTSSVDLMVLDRLLPRLDGLSVLKKLRLSERGREVPVILLTGATEETDRTTVLGAGADLVLAKPCLPDDLEKAIRALVERPRRGA